MSEVTFSVTFDNPDENLEAELLPSLMLNILDKWKVAYHDAVVELAEATTFNDPAVCTFCGWGFHDLDRSTHDPALHDWCWQLANQI